jgi:GNAT superfamily N-acetyltransferase
MSAPVRAAVSADIPAVVDVFTAAFFDDPLWGPVFPDVSLRAEQASAFWGIFVRSALRYPWLLVTASVEAAALWIPPGGTDLTDAEESSFADDLLAIAGRSVAEEISTLFESFAAAHPHSPHYYLSLLGTHTLHRGGGLGMALLAESLRRIDLEGSPAYLESCNPANNARYARLGFVEHGSFAAPSGHVVTTMWRAAR